jgi:hypothetical protein
MESNKSMEPKLSPQLGELFINFRYEREIEEYKAFYKRYLANVKNRNLVLTDLAIINQKFALKNPAVVTYLDKDYLQLVTEGKKILSKHFPQELVGLYEKDFPVAEKETKEFNNILLSLLAIFTNAFESLRAANQQDFNYKKNLLLFIYSCFSAYGLHPNILKRDPSESKRFNLIITHYYRSKKPIIETKHFLTYVEFCNQFLKLYLDKKPIKFGGKLIPFSKIHEVTITTTILKEDEIPLFGTKNNFVWRDNHKDIEKFIRCCQDETETYHPNPFDPSTYSKEINLLLIEQAKEFLRPFPDAHKLYIQALSNFDRNVVERHVLDDLRLSLEKLLRHILKNQKSLENQLPILGKYKKDKGYSPEIINMFQKILEYYAQYQNNYVKHDDKVNSGEVELIINLTTTFMRFIIR